MPRRSEQIPDIEDAGDASDLSKTQLKKAMQELQDLGAALLQLPEATLAKLPMHDPLREALRDLRRLTNHGAHKRQLQYVGKLMRLEDATPFRSALADMHAGRVRGINALKEIERWRDRLIDDETALAAWAKAYPASDTPAFRSLVRNAQRERKLAIATAERTHSELSNGPFYRALFKDLRDTLLAPSTTGEVKS